MNNTSPTLKAFKRAASLELSKWYMGSLTTNLAEKKDTNGVCFVEVTLAPGHEPPPHVHSREDELFYVLEGEFDVYAGDEAYKGEVGDCIFLPRFKPHAFLIRSPRIRMLTLFTPAGFEEALRGVSSPAQSLELPAGVRTYSTTDLKQTAERFGSYGIRFLTSDEVAEHLPLYPKPLSPNPASNQTF
jgi:quercetin dioxygenase-like cupin family protein